MKMIASGFPSFLKSFQKPRKVLWRLKSLKFQISVLYAFSLGVILLIFSGGLYLILSHTLYAELDNELKTKAQAISQTIRAYLDIRGEEPDGRETRGPFGSGSGTDQEQDGHAS